MQFDYSHSYMPHAVITENYRKNTLGNPAIGQLTAFWQGIKKAPRLCGALK
jgi:hypothetical protein